MDGRPPPIGKKRMRGRGPLKRKSDDKAAVAAQCQKCLEKGHWTFECKNEGVYLKRVSRTKQLINPKLRQPFNKEKPPEKGEKINAQQPKLKRRRRKDSTSSDSSSSSSSSSSSGSSSSSSSDSSSSSSSDDEN